MESTQLHGSNDSRTQDQINSTRDQTSKPDSFPTYTAESQALQGIQGGIVENGGAAEVESIRGAVESEDDIQRLDSAHSRNCVDDSLNPSLAPAENGPGSSFQQRTLLKRAPGGTYAYTLEEDKIVLQAMDGNLNDSEDRYDYLATERALKSHWSNLGVTEVTRSRGSIKQRLSKLKAIQEIGLDPLSYVSRPWTAEEDAKVLALDSNFVHLNGRTAPDYGAATALFPGRPKFEIRHRRDALMTKEVRKKARKEKQKKATETVKGEQGSSTPASTSTLASVPLTISRSSQNSISHPEASSLSAVLPHVDSTFTSSAPLNSFFAQFAAFSAVPQKAALNSPTSTPVPSVEEDSTSTPTSLVESKNDNDTPFPLPQTGYTLRSRPKSTRRSAPPTSQPPVPSFLNSDYHYDYVPRKISSRKRSNPELTSPPLQVDSRKKRKTSATPSTVSSPAPPFTHSNVTAQQEFVLVGIEVAREGIEILKTIRKKLEELDSEWDEVTNEYRFEVQENKV